ncbi:hypothetical protein NDU88_003741 [Pleurodeles waltl]|uniref:Uncharacterized protein n=1 Tax=Pleurodeles waltl TaxID=8319 RepID=A0AAV7NLJ9_PLEWA|nr:hypothetical protein NDU88_003741 [Pleurodeles waltl]
MNLRRNRSPTAYTYSFFLDAVLTNARDLLKLFPLRRKLPAGSDRQPLQESSLAPTAECSRQPRQLGPRRNNRTDARRTQAEKGNKATARMGCDKGTKAAAPEAWLPEQVHAQDK